MQGVTEMRRGTIYMRAWRARNPERAKEIQRAFYARNPGYSSKRYAANRKKLNAQQRANNASKLAWRRAFAKDHPEEYRERNRRDAANRRGRRRGYPPISRADLRALVDSYLGLCVYCLRPYEHLDHVVPLAAGGAHTVENIVPACATCNVSKNKIGLVVWLSRK